MTAQRPLRIAVVGAGPAGIYAANFLLESDTPMSIDLIERLPAPFGLIRYGVAPDHPRIKGIVSALHRVLDKPGVRFIGNVDVGSDIDLETMRRFYDAVIFSTGADTDRVLPMPGIELAGSHGAADFVSWYDGHPDVARWWDLGAERVAVLGVGNVALDVARVLAKPLDELMLTEIPSNVVDCLRESRVREVHVFGRRGPAQAKFSPLELRELEHSPGVEVIVRPEDMVFDEGSVMARSTSKQVETVAATLQAWADRGRTGAARSIHLHFMEAPVEVLGEEGRVVGLRTERTRLDGTGEAVGTGTFTEWPVEAVYRAVGYRSRPLEGLPFDERRGVVPNRGGRVCWPDGSVMESTYVTGWIKRGPVGLIGHTKGDANETVAHLLADAPGLARAVDPDERAVVAYLEERGVTHTSWPGWARLDAHERSLGAVEGRKRIKVVDRDAMIAVSSSRVDEIAAQHV